MKRMFSLSLSLFSMLTLLLSAPVLAQEAPPVLPGAPTLGQQILQSFVQYVVVPLLIPAFGTLALWALKKLSDFLGAKAAESKAALIGQKLATAAQSVVAEINATMRPKLEAALADGVLTDKEKSELKAAAIDLLKSKLPGDLLKAAGAIFGDFLDTHLSGLVERSLLDQKAKAAVASTPEAAVPPTP